LSAFVLIDDVVAGSKDLTADFGAKAQGFAAVPRHWRPPALVVSHALFDAYRRADGAFEALSETLWCALPSFAGNPTAALIVRSSATSETMKERGLYKSTRILASDSLHRFRAVIAAIFDDFVQAKTNGAMCLIVQRYVEAVEFGFLSNEHRLAAKPYQWVLERTVAAKREGVDIKGMSAKQAAEVSTGEPLVCLSRQEMLSRLRSVAKHFWKTNPSQRLLLEWCWDGSKLWILQRDVDVLSPTGRTPESIVNAFPPPPVSDTGKVFQRYEVGTSSPWGKLCNVADFATGGRLPPHRLFFAAADRINTAITTPASRQALAAEIDALTAGRAVLRTDCLRKTQNLKRTNTVDGKAAVEWLRIQIAHWYGGGTALTDVVFILHSYIPARAAAWSHYKAGASVVRVDGLWGLADGMQYYPTDTFVCRANNGELLSETIRFKELVLLEQADGSWVTEQILGRCARHRALTREERCDIATRTKAISDNIGSDVQIMWFVGVPASHGLEPNLPWYKETPEQDLEERKSRPLLAIKIRSDQDLAKLEGLSPASRKIILEPAGEFIRSNEFIRKVSAAAIRLNLPIEIRGSVLSHAFHQLRSQGAQVYSADPGRKFQDMRQRRAFDKLVRDEIPRNIEAKGEAVSASEIDRSELTVALLGKLFEESGELLTADTAEARTEELADMYEIVRALADAAGVGLEAVGRKADSKRSKRGGFERGVILRSTSALGPVQTPPALFDDNTSHKPVSLSAIRDPAQPGRRVQVMAAALLASGPQVVRLQTRGNVVVTVKVELAGGEIALSAVEVIDPADTNQPDMLR
jgi:predicted house-cleaning noncanonical NTP pyrophosphatase (MazG superfamily)